MPQGSLLLTNHSSYASKLTIPRGKLEALDEIASILETKGRSSRGRESPLLLPRGRRPLLKFRFAEPSFELIFGVSS